MLLNVINLLLVSLTPKPLYITSVNQLNILQDKKEVDLSNLREYIIYTYSTEHLAKKDKVRFYYALKGRDGISGIVKRLNIDHLGRTVLMVRKEYEQDVDQFFEVWKCPIEKREVYMKR